MKFDLTFDLIAQDKKTQTTRPLKWYEWYKDKIGQTFYAEANKQSSVKDLPTNTKMNLSQVQQVLTDKPRILCSITDVFITTLDEIAKRPEHYVREGFKTGEEFKETWKKLYGSWYDDLRVCVIRFVKI